MAGVTHGRVPVYTALPHPVTPRATTAKTSQFSARLDHDPDGHVTVQIHLQLLTATLVLQLEPGSCSCRRKYRRSSCSSQ